MSYHVFYGDSLAMANRDRHRDERVRFERFSTEPEELRRAREQREEDDRAAVAVCDAAGNQLTGVRLQLRLGYSCD